MHALSSTVAANTTGYNALGGPILSYGDNTIDDNGNDFGTLGSVSRQ